MEKELKAGDQAPDFSLPNESGKPISLTSFRGKPVILYFYPKDDTPGCTKEACAFRDSLKRVEKAGSVVLGVSLDDGESHRKFIAKHRLPFPLLSDVNATVSKAYGVYKQKHMYGKKFWGIERSTFVIGEAGIIKAVFRKVKLDGHIEEVLAALKKG